MGYLGSEEPLQVVEPKPSWGPGKTLMVLNLDGLVNTAIAGVVAAVVSYKRNKSYLWALGSSFVSLPYLTYIGIQGFSEPGGLKGQLKPLKKNGRKSRKGKGRKRNSHRRKNGHRRKRSRKSRRRGRR